MKRAIGVAALGGGLLALSAGAASGQEVSADASASLGRPTSAEVRVCADGRVLSGLLGSCRSGGTSDSVQAGRDDGSSGIRARVRVPRTLETDVSAGTRRSRPRAGAAGQASATPARAARADAAAAADTSPSARAAASARRSRPLLELRPLASLAGVGLLGSSPFTLVGDPATGTLLSIGELTLGDLGDEAPAGIGVLESGPIASGNQVGADVGDVSPSVPVTVCGNGVGVLGDAAAGCAPARQPAASPGSSGSGGSGSSGAPTGPGTATSGSLLDLGSGNQVDAGIGDVSPSVPVMVCGNGVGVLGGASAGCGTGQQAGTGGGSTGSAGSGSAGVSAGTGGSDVGLVDDLATGNQVDAGIGSVAASAPFTVCGNSVGALWDADARCGAAQPSGSGGSPTGSGGTGDDGAEVGVEGASATVPVAACGNSVGLLGDASSSCGSSTSSSGIIAPPPSTAPGTDPGQTGTVGIPGTPTGTTGTSGIPGTTGLATDGPGGATSFAPLRPSVSGSGALPFTGAAGDLLAMVAAGLLAAGVLVVRATRPAAATEGGGDR